MQKSITNYIEEPWMLGKSPDFIIPFLISHSAEGISKMHCTVKKKRYSAQQKLKETNTNSSMELTKIYKTYRKRSSSEKTEKQKSPHRTEKIGKMQKQQKIEDQFGEKGCSQLQLTLHKSPYIARNRFFKAHSLINHLPSPNFIDDFTQIKQTPQKMEVHSPIPGVRFKKKSTYNESANLLPPQTPDQDYKNEYSGKIKQWREKKEWSRKRSANVDFIINRKCKNFKDLVGQYRKRLSLLETARIFIFNSKDQWMKRTLGERGWIQNFNKQSRAFHLYWSSKVYKQPVFPEQVVNHYQNSDLLTSKAGLHRMLLKYGLTHLQPITFDLNLQRTEFILFFTKLAFIGKLKKLIKKFQFEQQPSNANFQELRAQINVLKRKSQLKGVIESDLFGLIENCFLLLDGKLHELTTCYVDNAIFKIHSMLQINPLQQELIRILRDFQVLCQQLKLFEGLIDTGLENIWLSKSKNSSKGVGISLHKDIDDILKHSNRLAQKYIQNPLIFTDPSIRGRKFDIRIWVLLIGNMKARVYYHQKFYGRLCFQAYSLDTINLDNQKKHLTNYSQNKQSFSDDALSNSIMLPDVIFDLIQRQKSIDYRINFFQKVQVMLSKMSTIFRNQIASGNPNSFQLFGLDMLIDNNLNLHLLEVNLSAACEERHEALTNMMADVAHGMLNILEGRKQDSDLRGWKLIK